MALLASERPDIKLVITAGKPASAGGARFDAVAQVRALAAELEVLDRTVLFFDDWIPYEQRYDYLRDADLGVTLHRDAAEARLAARSRYMDYLAACLPAVLGRGDEMAEDFAAAGFATLLDQPDERLLASTLCRLADDHEARRSAQQAGAGLANGYSWVAVGARLRTALASAPAPRVRHPAVIASAVAYYGLRFRDRLADADLGARIAARGLARDQVGAEVRR
jgi:glycosyltransferase involved in cell wall biosynthesis